MDFKNSFMVKNGIKIFPRLRKIIKSNGWKPIFATISAFTILYFIKYLYDFCLSNEWSWMSALASMGTIGYLYNNYCQTKDVDAKNALLKDWHDLPLVTHLIIIFIAVMLLSFFAYKKFFSDLFKSNGHIKDIKKIVYGN